MSSDSNLRKHYNNVHRKLFSCTYCNNTFPKRRQLSAHIFSHTGVPPFRCDRCDIGCASEYELKRHQRGHKTHTCTVTGCNLTFDLWTQLRKHAKLEHPLQFACLKCNKVFKTKHNLKLHIEIHEDPDKREVLTCPHDNCPRFYLHKRNLTHHIQSSHLGKLLECKHPGCGRKLCTKQKLQDHMKLHSPYGPLPRRRNQQTKERKKRRDAGKHKRSVAVKLSGLVVPYEVEKQCLHGEDVNNTVMSDAIKVSSLEKQVTIPYFDLNIRQINDKTKNLEETHSEPSSFNTSIEENYKNYNIDDDKYDHNIETNEKLFHNIEAHEESDGNSKIGEESDEYIDITESERDIDIRQESDMNAKIRNNLESDIEIFQSERNTDLHQGSDMHAKIVKESEQAIEIKESERCIDLVKEAQEYIEMDESEKDFNTYQESDANSKMSEKSEEDNDRNESESDNDAHEESDEYIDVVGVEEEMVIKVNNTDKEYKAEEDSDEDSEIDIESKENSEINTDSEDDSELEEDSEENEVAEEYITFNEIEKTEYNIKTGNAPKYNLIGDKMIEASKEHKMEIDVDLSDLNVDLSDLNVEENEGKEIIGEAQHNHKINTDAALLTGGIEINEGLNEDVEICEEFEDVNEIKEESNENVEICKKDFEINEESDEYIDVGIEDEVNILVEVPEKDNKLEEESDDITVEEGSDYDTIEDDVDIIEEEYGKHNKLEEETKINKCVEKESKDKNEVDQFVKETETTNSIGINQATNFGCDFKEDELKEIFMINEQIKTQIGPDEELKNGSAFHKQGEIDTVKKNEDKEETTTKKIIKKGTDEDKPGKMMEDGMQSTNVKKMGDISPTNLKNFIATMLRVMEHLFPLINEGISENFEMETDENRIEETVKKDYQYDLDHKTGAKWIECCFCLQWSHYGCEGLHVDYGEDGMPEEIMSHIISADENKTSIQVKTASLSCDNVPLKDYTPVLACNETISESLVNLKLLSSRKETEDEDEDEDINVEVFCGDSDDEDSFNSKVSFESHFVTHKREKPFKCLSCGVSFMLNASLIRHSTIHNGQAYKCTDCGKLVRSKSALKRHIETHMPEKAFKCALCDLQFRTKEHLLRHNDIHTNYRPFECADCGRCFRQKVFKHKVGLKKHISMHSFNESQDECEKDQNIVFKDLVVNNSLDRGSSGRKSMPMKSRHTLGGMALNENKCLICGKCFKAKRVLQSHIQTHTEGRIYMCNECGKSFNVKSVWQSHIQTHTEGRIYTCNECGKIFNVKRALEIHFQTHTGDRPYKCDKCEKTFGFKSHLMRHMLIHNRQKPYKCAECGYHSRVKWNLKVHMENHIGQKEKVWKCPECDESFESFTCLTSHKSLHKAKEPHKCVKCGHFFKSIRELLDHHSREGKLVECSECGKSFKQMGALRKHMAHHDLKPYLCVLCGKYFRTEMNLSGHVLTHGQSNECPICRKCFKRKAYLQKHVLLHSNNKMYECTVCGKRFHQKSYLAKHSSAVSCELSVSTKEDMGLLYLICELSVSTKEAMELLYFLEVKTDNPVFG
uniref:(California timema) hypothetical protein n=1 Tax=Timema californicum TaxID=61474 RepID=A0A7R9J8D9_TIMCA|nr:unnamed protein product [Timema californicum]